MQTRDPAQYQYNEEGYYSDGSVWVTSRRLIYAGGYHMLRSVRGVRLRIVTAEDRMRNLTTSLLAYTGVLALMWFSPDQNMVLRVISICGLLLLPVEFIWLMLKRDKMPQEPVYTASIRYRFWSAKAAASTDQAYIERIVEVIQYAIAHRDSKPYTMAPPSIGHSFKIPSPIIRGNLLYVGQTAYDLATIRSVAVATGTGTTGSRQTLLGLILAPQILYGSSYRPEGLLGAITLVGLTLANLCLLALMFAPPSNWPELHVVEITPRTGPRAIVFASTSKADAQEVKQSINESRKPEAALQTSQGAHY
jgi:hypothetical protein